MEDRDLKTQWLEYIQNVNVWKKGNKRAVHKPLLTLYLIAQASKQHTAHFSYQEIEEPVQRYLDDFGSGTKSSPLYPFWYLTNEGYWTIPDKNELSQLFKTPSRPIFLERNTQALVPEELWQLLCKDQQLRIELQEILLNNFWADSLHQDIRDAIGLDHDDYITTQKRKRDPNFRIEVIRAYQRRCAICDYDAQLSGNLFGLEAAHVKWHAYGGLDTIDNGIALCSFHHKAFDKGAIGLNDDLKLIVSSDLSGNKMLEQLVYEFENKAIRTPQGGFLPPNDRYIEWHYTNVFRRPERVA